MKFHWKPALGLQSVVWNEAVKINGADPDFHRRDLWDAITQGAFPEWELGLQVFDDEFADRFAFDVLDPTKIIPEEDVPGPAGGPAGPGPGGGQLLRRDRTGGLLHPEHRARHRLHQRPAPARPELLLPGHPAQTAGQPQLHPPAGQRPEMSRSPPSNRTATWPPSTRPAGPTTNRTPGARSAGGPGEDPAGFVSTPTVETGPKRRLRADSFADHYSQARQFLDQPNPRRTPAHRRRFRVRVEQMPAAGHPPADGGRPAQRGRRPGRRGRATGWAWPNCPTGSSRPARPGPTWRPHRR